MSNKNNYNYYETRKFPQNKSTRKKKNYFNYITPSYHPKYKNRNTISQRNNYYRNENREMNLYLNETYSHYNNHNHKHERKKDNSFNINNISLNKTAKEFVSTNIKPYEEAIIQETNENEEKEKEEKAIETYVYTYEYLIQFEKLKKSMDTNFLPEQTLIHINEIEKELKEMKKKNFITSSNYSSCNTSQNSSSSNLIPLEKWAKKDYSKEFKLAEENKKKFEESNNVDKTKKQLRELLNILTKDNYEETKKQIFQIIKDDIECQEKFIEVFFPKACMEKAYVELHAKLCKDLNNELPQKEESKEKNKKSVSSIFRLILRDKCRNALKGKNFDKYIREKDPIERENAIKKLSLGNVNFITELMKNKVLSKSIAPKCMNFLLGKYDNEKDKKLKQIYILSILVFIDKLGTLIHTENFNPNIIQKYNNNIEEIIKKLEKIKNDPDLSGYVEYSIINLIEKKNNNYEKTKFEKYILAKSKKEVEEEFNNKEKAKKNENKMEEGIYQEYINERIKNDLIKYKDFVENEGNSNQYPWNVITNLYDKKQKNLDKILEGYMSSCGDFIEKEENIKYAKDYIKELIEYYNRIIYEEEKNNLKKKLLCLFDIVRDLAFETPQIYDLYAYVIYIFLENKIIKIEDLENIIKKEELTKDDLNPLNTIYKSVYKYYKEKSFKSALKKFGFIDKNKELFKWVFNNKEGE